jgi:hypothetical protein
VDLFTSEQPALWVQQLPEGEMRLGLTNWSDSRETGTLDLAALTGSAWRQVRDFWTGEEIGTSAKEVALSLAPHETKLLVLAG